MCNKNITKSPCGSAYRSPNQMSIQARDLPAKSLPLPSYLNLPYLGGKHWSHDFLFKYRCYALWSHPLP